MTTAQNTASPSEALATKVAEAIARGEDPLGDNDGYEVEEEEGGDDASTTTTEATDTTEVDATAEAATATATTETDDEAAAAADAADRSTEAADALDTAALEAVAADDAEPEVLEVSQKDFKAERERLDAAADTIEQRWTKGELSDEDRVRELRKLRDETNDLIREETTAQTISDMNRQNMVRHQARVLRGIATESKAAGQLDYGDPKVGDAYDAMLNAVARDPENAGKSFQQLARLAHDGLCAVRGVKAAGAPAAQPAAAAPAAPARKTPAAPPVTLRTLPSASTPNTGGDALDALGSLKGQDYQAAFNHLSPAQKARLLDE